ncbi:TPA: hypothetical protein ACH3X1_015783 [Trebouxia sp. C0004]
MPTFYQSSAGSLLLTSIPTSHQMRRLQNLAQAVLLHRSHARHLADTTDCTAFAKTCVILSQAADALHCSQLYSTSASACCSISNLLTEVSDPIMCTADLALLSLCAISQTCSSLASNIG